VWQKEPLDFQCTLNITFKHYSIPESTRAADNVHTFKHLIKTHFLTFLTDVIYLSVPCCYFNCFDTVLPSRSVSRTLGTK